jgi:energy-coupling factor transport system permease protein
MKQSFHPLTWALWLLAGLVILSTTRNPIYLGLALTWLATVSLTVRLVGIAVNPPRLLSSPRFGLVVIPLATLVNALNVHFGETILMALPRHLPLIGGPITLEAVVYGFLNGVVLTGIYALFALVNQVLSMRAIVGLIPRTYYPLAIVVTIALTFAPLTVRQIQAIREAQAIRGHRMRGIRDWLPLFLPLLLGGLERALQLAEAMTARGFASAQQGSSIPLRLSLVTGLASVVGGLWLQLMRPGAAVGGLVTLSGSALVIGGLWLTGRPQPHTVYRPAPFRHQDWLVMTAALGPLLLFLLPVFDRSSIFYYPYPTLTWPEFSLLHGVATWGLVAPALVLFSHPEKVTEKCTHGNR